MELKEYRRPCCRVIEVKVRESVLLNDSQVFGINYWDEENGEEYDF